MAKRSRAVFLNQNGTLIKHVPQNADPARVELLPGAANALQRITARGFRLLVIANQPGVALGKYPESALPALEARIQELLRSANVAIDGFYYCPHLPNAPVAQYAVRCTCRKPKAGMLHHAAAQWDLDLQRSWLVGDVLDDVEAGRRGGCQTILVVNGTETEWRAAPARVPDWYARNLSQATRLILANESPAAEPRQPVRRVPPFRIPGQMPPALRPTPELANRA